MPGTTREPIGKLYLVSVLLFMLLLPLISTFVNWYPCVSLNATAGKWFLFWGVGLRLLTAGVRQVINPAFTAKDIFHMQHEEGFPIVRELGFANVCMGAVAVVSLFLPSWRMAAAAGGGLYFGLAELMHCFKRPATPNEWIALVSDLFIFLVMAAYEVTTAS